MSVLVVTGTGTEVGKTVATAAVAAVRTASGERVAVLKPAQTGVVGAQRGDADEVARLVPGVTAVELARYPEPLAPATAARRAALPPMPVRRVAEAVAGLRERHDLVLVEGAGGLLVRFDDTGATIADAAAELGAPVLVVARSGLGTLNATALTTEALRARGLDCPGVLIGGWPPAPDLAERCNLADLPEAAGAPLLGALPEGLPRRPAKEFAAAAAAALAPPLGGTWNAQAFRHRYAPEPGLNRVRTPAGPDCAG
ncbi:dethiobiotin synthetase [Spinactinospora alkalitolerans]|uniref:ATP-dependent dethiobiotin synthetase BioD n=1 Tax=Spinactinospora alkalitolerans TaxID=687207 RepID=A0A852TTK2_9ACTN|nr:dethiobiotin synthase [Spinactinospora alkalitolerans]NYE46182.1 dethiobiotin synthetase [Spinactinospora alkalitolerans]